MDLLASAEDALTALLAVVHRLDADDLAKPTPCTEYDVAALAEHLVATIGKFSAAAGLDASAPEGTTVAHRIDHVTRTALTAWRRRGLRADVAMGGRMMPAPLALGVLSVELLVHGWDFAVATQHPLEVSDAHADFVLQVARQTLTPHSRITVGFDDPVPFADDGSPLDRLVAFTGRNPSWPNSRLRTR
jgi:uncharacterized protein (TIGR03086 family)